jgi:hypothetical protein
MRRADILLLSKASLMTIAVTIIGVLSCEQAADVPPVVQHLQPHQKPNQHLINAFGLRIREKERRNVMTIN